MEIKVTLEDYKDIQEFKKAMNTSCDKMVEDLKSTFSTKQVEILSQIDGYLKGITMQLKGSRMYNGANWIFYSNDRWKNSDDTYPSRVAFVPKDDGTYILKVRLFSQYSGEKDYDVMIENGDIHIFTDYKSILEKKQLYIETIIKNWKDLKKAINDLIMKDLENSQKMNNNKLDVIMKRNSYYDEFEL